MTPIHEWFAAARNVDLRAIGADAVPTVGSKEGVALMASLLHFGEGDVVVQPKVSVSDVRDRHAVAGRANAEGRRRGGCGFLEGCAGRQGRLGQFAVQSDR